MIYEKRNADFIIKKEDMPIKNQVIPKMPEERKELSERLTQIKQEAAPEQRSFCKNVRRKSLKNKRILSAVLVLLCVFTIDEKLFGGRICSEVVSCAEKGVKYALENVAEEAVSGESTLYTRLLSDRSAELVDKDEPVYESTQITLEEMTENPAQTVTVVNSTSSSFVDGERFHPITTLDLSADSLYSLTNSTSLSPDLERLSVVSPKALDMVEITDEPLVLILHTHGEESYTDYTGMYPETEPTRSSDTEKNVVRVGKEIKDTLSDFGINAIHCTKMHDSESFINAYSGSAASVKQYLKEYPSIKIVIDVHRDAIIKDDGESIKAAVEIAGKEYAQLMFVVGTNALGHNHPEWQDNLSLALTLQQSIDSTYPSLCRSINLRDVPFNQQLSSGYLLLEVGTCANTLDEALRSARAFGENLARTLASAQ